MEHIQGYDNWKTTPTEEIKPVTYCACCKDPLYEGEALYAIDGGICESCLNDNYKTLV